MSVIWDMMPCNAV